jgi:GR25 family glycosyltransferase involved in LPS biosynthesis
MHLVGMRTLVIIAIVLIIFLLYSYSITIEMNYFVINMKDRPDKFAYFNRQSGRKFIRLDGVNIKESKYLYVDAIQEGIHENTILLQEKAGWIGVGLAHIEAWKLAARSSGFSMITEDDCIFKRNWQKNVEKSLCHLLSYDADFDLLLLNVLRPKGTSVGNHILKIEPSRTQLPSNVWLSCYIVTPCGAQKLIQNMKNIKVDLNKTQIDWFLSKNIYGTHSRAYCIDKTNLYFIHNEKDSDKIRMNNR